MTIAIDNPVGRIAAEYPLATWVFARHGIDYCCGGGRPLQDVCDDKGLDAATVLEEIRKELDTADVSEERWDQAPPADLVEHILFAYHRPLREELPRLESMARKVLEVHRDKAPQALPELISVYLGMKAELDDHMAKEEHILFPMIKRGEGFMANGPIEVMLHEHETVAIALRRLRELTGNYEVPANACNTWRALWHGLAALETSLHRHIHLENNILFPRALAS